MRRSAVGTGLRCGLCQGCWRLTASSAPPSSPLSLLPPWAGEGEILSEHGCSNVPSGSKIRYHGPHGENQRGLVPVDFSGSSRHRPRENEGKRWIGRIRDLWSRPPIYVNGKRFRFPRRPKCGSVVRTKQSFRNAIAAIARSVSGRRCPFDASCLPSFAATRQSSQIGSRSCKPLSEEATQSACSSRRKPCKTSARIIPVNAARSSSSKISTILCSFDCLRLKNPTQMQVSIKTSSLREIVMAIVDLSLFQSTPIIDHLNLTRELFEAHSACVANVISHGYTNRCSRITLFGQFA